MAPSSSTAPTTSVQVAVRIRPTTNADTTSIPARFQRSVIHATSPNSVSVDATSATPSAAGPATAVAPTAGPGKKQAFTFDQVHDPSTTQHAIFTSTAQPLISRFLEGFNCTILAYGQTSSGKTHTMTGVDLDADPTDPHTGMGIIPRAVSTIFSRARKLKEERAGSWNYSIKGSFIEIYNEDLIDLLNSDDPAGGRREVQIREDKDGHIIWGGLREVGVKNSNEVMNLIRQGTSIRRTNETEMNATSSRSHAIFSLTLTQKKYTGSGPPPRSSSPLPPNGRSPSRLARPGSMYTGAGASGTTTRASSPTQTRAPTPSFSAAMGRGGGQRPNSAMGLRPSDSRSSVDEDAGEWTTIVSKFHFVDLAGSERLKRTAAAGERIKEGISINSGLLALGNVISALGDPSRAKSHTATHIPYRDSKLTRLLQDSLGGNAHTMMIACVSPTEWNAGETVNTLKYANRARNIKNRAVVNEKEDGWDDVEWLQGTVTRLRKELKHIKETGGGGPGSAASSGNHLDLVEGAGKKVLAQLTGLQNNYEDLREKYVERTEELTRLRQELGERHRSSSGGTITGMSKYEEIVGPVIEEYEKTIGAMEAELSLNRAALRHTNEMVEEKEEELAAITERHSQTELYLEELRSRVSKLTEREASTEAYIHDLEEKVKHYDESSITSSESLSDLKREISRFKEADSSSSKYIADLEARLARSDESVLALQQSVERLESEAERRRAEAEVLQSRLDALQKDGLSWRSDLEERERKVQDLELKMAEWEQKRKEAGEERSRLGGVVTDVAQALRLVSPTKPAVNGAHSGSSTPSNAEADGSIESQLVNLQQTHTATLADLSSVTAKYRDALREISDLAAQIQEAKLSNTAASSSVAEFPAGETNPDLPAPTRRRPTMPRSREPSEPVYNAQGRRLFFRQAASTESLHSRSLSQSQSLSQELSSARSRKASISSSHGTSSSLSYSPSSHRPNLSISLPGLNVNPHERSVPSLEKEIMRLQEVLKERESEISTLESSLSAAGTPRDRVQPTILSEELQPKDNGKDDPNLSPKTMSQFAVIRRSMEIQKFDRLPHENGHAENGSVPDADDSLTRLNELMLSMAQKESAHRDLVDDLSQQLAQVRREHDSLTTLSRDQAHNMSTELEALRGRHEEDLEKLEQAQKHEAELIEALANAESEHAALVDVLRHEHEEALRDKEDEVDALLERLKSEHAEVIQGLQSQLDEAATSATSLQSMHTEAIDKIRADHENELRRRGQETEDVRRQLSEATAALSDAHRNHNDAFGKLRAEHEQELQRRVQEVSDILDRTRQEHVAELSRLSDDHARVLRKSEEDSSATLHRTEEEYYNALTKLRTDHSEAMEKQSSEAVATLNRMREEHAGELRMAEIARQGTLSESESSQAVTLQKLQEEHSAAISRKDMILAEELENLKAAHSQALSSKDRDHTSRVERLKSKHSNALAVKDEEHESQLEELRSSHAMELARLQDQLSTELERFKSLEAKSKEDMDRATQKHQDDHEAAVRTLQEQQSALLQEITRGHEDENVALKQSHNIALKEVASRAEEDRASLARTHTEVMARLKAEHQQALAEVNETLIATREKHASDLEASRLKHEEALTNERERLAASLASLQQQQTEERKSFQKDRDMLLNEIETHKSTVAVLERERDQLAEARLQDRQAYDALQSDHDLLVQELESHKAAADDFSTHIEELRESHAKILDQKAGELSSVHAERDTLRAALVKLQEELDSTRNEQSKLVQEASKRESLVDELEKHRSVLAEVQENLQKVRDEKDNIQAEKIRQDTTLRDLQAQIARFSTPQESTPQRPGAERSVSYNRTTGLPAMKPPPPTPPPSVPPPPTPRNAPTVSTDTFSPTTQGSSFLTSATSRESALDSPMSSVNGINGVVDSKVSARLEEQAKHIDEQEAMIKTLNKQLSHCESDLQAHMDLVGTLETSLGDSEKNLRKVRMQATELARERDSLNGQIDNLRAELTDAKREVANVRRSIVEEKQSLEHRLDEERRAKERARQQLDTRMEELQKRKSKFACL